MGQASETAASGRSLRPATDQEGSCPVAAEAGIPSLTSGSGLLASFACTMSTCSTRLVCR